MKFQPNSYLAFVLSEDSRARLLTRVEPLFSRVLCHHVTIVFNLTEDLLNELTEQLEDPKVMITSYALGDDVECFTVTVNGNAKRRDGELYHLTHSVEPPAKPVDSNKLLRSGTGIVQPLNIQIFGELKLIPKR